MSNPSELARQAAEETTRRDEQQGWSYGENVGAVLNDALATMRIAVRDQIGFTGMACIAATARLKISIKKIEDLLNRE